MKSLLTFPSLHEDYMSHMTYTGLSAPGFLKQQSSLNHDICGCLAPFFLFEEKYHQGLSLTSRNFFPLTMFCLKFFPLNT